MTTLTIMIIVAFVLGYACIATESLLKVNKAAIASRPKRLPMKIPSTMT